MRYLKKIGVFAAVLTLFSGLSFAEHVIDDSKNTSYLFVISGSSGSLDGDTLTLKGVPNIVYFSDRPARQAGHLSLDKFMDMSSDSFKADPPNAVLSILNNNENIVVEIQDPKLQENDILFKIKILQGTAQAQFKQSSLFIDTICGLICDGAGGG